MDTLTRQVNMARYMLLGTVIITVVDLFLLLTNADFFIPYCAAVPYYLVWLGVLFDNQYSAYVANIGEYTATGLVMAAVTLVVLLTVWLLAQRRLTWLKMGMGLLIADTVVLAVVAFALMSDPMSCLMEMVIHVAVIWEVSQGIKAQKQMETILAAPPVWSEPPQVPEETPESEETPEQEEEYV